MSAIAEIRHHTKVVEETRKITKAMHMISSSKMKRAVRMHQLDQAYFNHVRASIKFILANSSELTHPFFRHRPGERTAYLVIAADKGLCGAYNQNVLKLVDQHMKTRNETSIFTIGQMAREHFQRADIMVDVEYLHVIADPQLQDAREITMALCELYNLDQLDEVYVAFTQMHSVMRQQAQLLRLLPILKEDFEDVTPLHAPTFELAFHPSPKAVLDLLVPQYLIGLTYGMLVESFASEQCARMAAMDAATRNADEMLGKLSLSLNRARQGAITQELSEIIGGAEALAHI